MQKFLPYIVIACIIVIPALAMLFIYKRNQRGRGKKNVSSGFADQEALRRIDLNYEE